MIRIFVTGGTFDKEYDELTGTLAFKETHLPEMLRLGRSRVDVSVRTLMMKDSLDMTAADRTLIVDECRRAGEMRILITHGTDTMVETRERSGRHCRRLPAKPWSSPARWCRTRSAAPMASSIWEARCPSCRRFRRAFTSR